jgi:hypothetical protein
MAAPRFRSRFKARFRTADVDASVEGGDHGALMAAAAQVAERRGWLRSWLSKALTVNLSGERGTSLHGSYPSETRVGLRVYVARHEYLLAMKLRAMRVGRREEQDAALLAHSCGIASLDGMLALLERYFPKEPPDPRRIAIVGQFVETLNAPTSNQPG